MGISTPVNAQTLTSQLPVHCPVQSTQLHIHANNCVVQNKNNTMLYVKLQIFLLVPFVESDPILYGGGSHKIHP